MTSTNKSSLTGFTLVELLVVISIITFLASLALVALSSARFKARTVKRVTDLRQIEKALELYRAKYGTYPNTAYEGRTECTLWYPNTPYQASDVIPGLVPEFISKFPSDPGMNKTAGSSCYIYVSNASGTEYTFLDHGISEFTYADCLKYPALVNPIRDGGTQNGAPNACLVDGNTPWSWSVSSEGGGCLW